MGRSNIGVLLFSSVFLFLFTILLILKALVYEPYKGLFLFGIFIIIIIFCMFSCSSVNKFTRKVKYGFLSISLPLIYSIIVAFQWFANIPSYDKSAFLLIFPIMILIGIAFFFVATMFIGIGFSYLTEKLFERLRERKKVRISFYVALVILIIINLPSLTYILYPPCMGSGFGILDSEHDSRCFRVVAAASLNEDYCEYAGSYNEYCVMDIAQLKRNPELCIEHDFFKGYDRNRCLQQFLNKPRDIKVCDKLFLNKTSTEHDNCLYLLAENVRDTGLCKQINDLSIKGNCYYELKSPDPFDPTYSGVSMDTDVDMDKIEEKKEHFKDIDVSNRRWDTVGGYDYMGREIHIDEIEVYYVDLDDDKLTDYIVYQLDLSLDTQEPHDYHFTIDTKINGNLFAWGHDEELDGGQNYVIIPVDARDIYSQRENRFPLSLRIYDFNSTISLKWYDFYEEEVDFFDFERYE